MTTWKQGDDPQQDPGDLPAMICTECLTEVWDYTANPDLVVCPKCNTFALRDYDAYSRERYEDMLESRYEADREWGD